MNCRRVPSGCCPRASGRPAAAPRADAERIGAGLRAEGILFVRSFPDGLADSQQSFSVAPGVQGWLGLHPGRWSIDFQHHLMIMAMAFTDTARHPLYGELLISVGYRF